MSKFEEPILPPQNGRAGARYESSNIEIKKLHEFLNTTIFEDKNAVLEVLSKEYKMTEREDVDLLRNNMTRVFNINELKMANLNGDKEYYGDPLSGKEPSAVIKTRIKTMDGNAYDLSIFEVFNRNDYFRHEFVLRPVEELN